jgi:transcriptional regulator with XRE-family HTH domain
VRQDADRFRLGALLRSHRLRLGLSQKDLAERAGLSERPLPRLLVRKLHRPLLSSRPGCMASRSWTPDLR